MSIWIKLDADFWRNAKVASAGLDAGVVFQELLAIGRRNSRDGVLPPRECSAHYLASLLSAVGMTVKRATSALQACATAEMIEVAEDGAVSIVGWDETWKPALSDSERQRQARAKSRHVTNGAVTPVTDSSVTVRDTGHGAGVAARHDHGVTTVTGGA